MDEEKEMTQAAAPKREDGAVIAGNGLLSGEEVVEVYCRPMPGEIVETYVRPLPGRNTVPAAAWKKRKKTGLWVFLLCFGLTAAMAAGAYFWNQSRIWNRWEYGVQTSEPVSKEITISTYPIGQGAALTVETGHGPEMTTQEIYVRVNPSVVTVMAQLETSMSVGTGVIFTENGYILTNYHVLEGGRDCEVALDSGRKYEAKYVAGDAKNDLAVLKVDLEGLPAAEFGDSDLLTVGDPVCAIGNPLGTELRGTLTDGIVSAINRDVQVDGRTMTLIQTNAALNSGNSGGPLINRYGQVVGINTIKMSSSYSSIEGLGFAIPSASIRYLVNDLLTYGEVQPEPVLGISVMQMGVQLENGLWGIQVLEVTPGSSADLAGVKEGDFVLSAGGIATESSRDLLRARRQYRVGEQMPVVLWRDGEPVEITLDLNQSAEEADGAAEDFHLP
ncbi:PDZ domain-containing protein [Oscillibacter sp. PC13]|uniref:S1C family serine protease n=1 Tax=Oscillibacter sp. PC13 TaxID=1855299 RepID=UPI0008E2566F|nr:trypsin-like peptidase domain-containing protein [Oscillibacter sp. PC13]SFP61624.1 PDZ domain-containing protein [Oscillibacter sp. PC13]